MMDIKEFLKTTLNIDNFDSTNNQYSYLFMFYDELQDHFKDFELPTLLLAELNQFGCQNVTYNDKNYILFDTSYFSIISKMCYFVLQGEVTSSLFDDVYDYLISQYKLNNKESNKMVYQKRIVEEIIHNDIFRPFFNIGNNKKVEQTVSLFIFAHEIIHSFLDKIKIRDEKDDFERWNKKFDFWELDNALDSILDKHNNIGLYNLISKNNTFKDEIYCDEIAIVIIWKYLIFRLGEYNPALFSVNLLLAMKSIKLLKIFELKLFDKDELNTILELNIREVLMQRHCLELYEKFFFTALKEEDTQTIIEMGMVTLGGYEDTIVIFYDVINISHIIIAKIFFKLLNIDLSDNYISLIKNSNIFVIPENRYNRYRTSEGNQLNERTILELIIYYTKLFDILYNITPFNNTTIFLTGEINQGKIENIFDPMMKQMSARSDFISKFNHCFPR